MKAFLITLIIALSIMSSSSLGIIAHLITPDRTPWWSLLGSLVISGIAVWLIIKVLDKED